VPYVRTKDSGTCFVTPWQPAIESHRTYRRLVPLPFLDTGPNSSTKLGGVALPLNVSPT
jgi:hypothetical protein